MDIFVFKYSNRLQILMWCPYIFFSLLHIYTFIKLLTSISFIHRFSKNSPRPFSKHWCASGGYWMCSLEIYKGKENTIVLKIYSAMK